MPPIGAIPAAIPVYDRADWRHWVDADGDCQNTRHEVLIEESFDLVDFKTVAQCSVVTGRWWAAYTNTEVTDASSLDIDHLVPLKNAHLSGAWAWDAELRRRYANSLDDPDHLIAVTAGANRAKGGRGPEEWKPPSQAYWCEYAWDWIRVKVTWELTVTAAEAAAIRDMLDTCETAVIVSPTRTGTPSADEIPAADDGTPTPTAARPAPPEPTDVQIELLACQGTPESVRIRNTGHERVSMDGWSLHDDGVKHTYDFPADLSLPPGSEVTVWSGGGAQGKTLFWKSSPVWNNDGDTAHLRNPSGEVVSTKACTQ